jgi:predicted phosphoribosyltransferase
MSIFTNRKDAGQQLARYLAQYGGRPDTIVLALPRGGVPVAAAAAKALRLPLDVFLVRKLGVPGQEELGMGAIASGGIRIINQQLTRQLGIPEAAIEAVTAREQRELARREREYRGGRAGPEVRGRTAILIDDGLATGSTMRAAIAALRQEGAARIVAAVPVGAARTCAEVGQEADEIVCLERPTDFRAIGEWYEDFTQTTDEEIRTLLREAEREDDGQSG